MVKLITTRAQLASRTKFYETAANTYKSFSPAVRADFKQLTIHTQAWVSLSFSDGSKGWVPVKFGAYDCTVDEYSSNRRSLDSSKAVEAVSKWGTEAPAGHADFQAIRDFCEARGLTCRSDFRVILISGILSVPGNTVAQARASNAEEEKDRFIADFILTALPSLCAAQRARVIALAATL